MGWRASGSIESKPRLSLHTDPNVNPTVSRHVSRTREHRRDTDYRLRTTAVLFFPTSTSLSLPVYRFSICMCCAVCVCDAAADVTTDSTRHAPSESRVATPTHVHRLMERKEERSTASLPLPLVRAHTYTHSRVDTKGEGGGGEPLRQGVLPLCASVWPRVLNRTSLIHSLTPFLHCFLSHSPRYSCQ